MHIKKHFSAIPVALGLCVFVGAGAIAVPASQAAVTRTVMAPVTKSGKFVKILSKTSFKMSVGSTSYIVTTNDMSHVTLDAKKVKLATLKKGDTVTVKGPLEMDTISATTVIAGM